MLDTCISVAEKKIAVIFPAYNEAASIADVVTDFYTQAPNVNIYVVDNNSSDGTADIARDTMNRINCKGEVLFEGYQGKAFAIRRAFRQVEADIYVMADADGTYRPEDLPALLEPVISGVADMVIGERFSGGRYDLATGRKFHNFGNRLVCGLVNFLFGGRLTDIMSGYRVMTKEFVKLCPLLGDGFEMETEMSIHGVDKKFALVEKPIKYCPRPVSSPSKLHTFKDGARIIKIIVLLFKQYRPMAFFGLTALLSFIVSLVVGMPVIFEFIRTGFILKIPSTILATGLAMVSILLFAIALILDSIARNSVIHFELMRRKYWGRRV
jgi:glycosyltransferase involved in cell wall biosynthesis